MVIDASAILAILQSEPERADFARLIAGSGVRLVSPINLFEVHAISRSRHKEEGVRRALEFVTESGMKVVPVDVAQLSAARDAFDRFGKGRHPAGLNLADCFAYALSKTSGEPLLFKGADFAKTDVIAAI
jgi:ribonuclease VapC